MHLDADKSLQDQFDPQGVCFGCGPANPQGLHIKSFVDGERAVAQWLPADHHQAFPGMVGGGIIGCLLDCHSNWTAAYFLGQSLKLDQPPCTVTADYHVTFKRPTPFSKPLVLSGSIAEIRDRRAVVEATLSVDDRVCATCRGTFVAIEPGHPAYYHRGR